MTSKHRAFIDAVKNHLDTMSDQLSAMRGEDREDGDVIALVPTRADVIRATRIARAMQDLLALHDVRTQVLAAGMLTIHINERAEVEPDVMAVAVARAVIATTEPTGLSRALRAANAPRESPEGHPAWPDDPDTDFDAGDAADDLEDEEEDHDAIDDLEDEDYDPDDYPEEDETDPPLHEPRVAAGADDHAPPGTDVARELRRQKAASIEEGLTRDPAGPDAPAS